MRVLFKNNAATVLTSDVSASATQLNVEDASVFPSITNSSECFIVTLVGEQNELEIVKVITSKANVLQVERGFESTVAKPWTSGTRVEMRITAHALNVATNQNADGTTIVEEDGILTAVTATSSKKGIVKPDGSTLTVSNGTMSINPSVFSTIYKFKGTVATVRDLPSNASDGDVYNVTANGMNYAWTGSAWDALGSIEEMDDVPTEGSFNPVTSDGIYKTISAFSSTVEGELDQLQTNINVVDAATKAAQSTANTNTGKINALTTRVTTAEKDIDSLESLTDSHTSSINSVTNRVTTAEKDIDSLESLTDSHTMDITGLELGVSVIENDVAELNSSVSAINDKLVDGRSVAAGTATKLATARTISLTGDGTASVSFDGSKNVSSAFTLKNSGVTAGSYGPSANATLAHGGTFVIPQITTDAKGITTAVVNRTLTLPAAPTTVSGNAGSATKLATARTIALSGGATGTATAFDGTANVTIPVTGLNMANATAGTLSLARGGTGRTDGKAPSLITARTIDGVSFNGTANITHFGTCSTAAATAEKTVSVPGFTLTTGAKVTVQFTVTNTVANPTLNVNGTGAKAILYRNAAFTAGHLAANRVLEFVYDGTNYEIVGHLDTNTDTKVTQTITTTDATYPILFSATADRSVSATEGARIATYPKVNPSTQKIVGPGITATGFGTSWINAAKENGAVIHNNGHTPAFIPFLSYKTSLGCFVQAGYNDTLMVYYVPDTYVEAGTNNAQYKFMFRTDGKFECPAGFVGPVTGNASTATALATARTVRTNLASTSTASFNGTANIAPGVTGVLPKTNGGTGNTTGTATTTNGIGKYTFVDTGATDRQPPTWLLGVNAEVDNSVIQPYFIPNVIGNKTGDNLNYYWTLNNGLTIMVGQGEANNTYTFMQPFAYVPHVYISGVNSGYTMSVNNITKTSFVAQTLDTSGTPIVGNRSVRWLAIGYMNI